MCTLEPYSLVRESCNDPLTGSRVGGVIEPPVVGINLIEGQPISLLNSQCTVERWNDKIRKIVCE